jgi:hypothetical protein
MKLKLVMTVMLRCQFVWVKLKHECPCISALWELGRLIHDIRRKWTIPAKCPCSQKADAKPITSGKNGMNQVRHTSVLCLFYQISFGARQGRSFSCVEIRDFSASFS